MSSNLPNDEGKLQKTVAFASKCIAIVLSHKTKEFKAIGVNEKDPVTSKEIADFAGDTSIEGKEINGKEIWDDFKLRNSTCYWNMSLLESIKSLEYYGFVHPCTLLTCGNDVHLENLRTAWGRRVLKPPRGFEVIRIGDVSGIEMQEVPQTQFIPLPDSLCLVILDLNNNRVVATVDTIKEKLRKTFKHMQIPEDWLIHNTLGNLIRERKLLHNGTGYFVVTPDTFLVPPMDPNYAWLPYHATQQIQQQSHLPKYPQMMMPHSALNQRTTQQSGPLPGLQPGHHAAFNQDQMCFVPSPNCLQHNYGTITRSACCQTDEALKTKTEKPVERTIKRSADKLINENDLFSTERRGRSHSVNCHRKSTSKGNGLIVRSSSVKQRNEKSKTEKENKNDLDKVKGEKISIFAKIFGKHRTKKEKEKLKEKEKNCPTTEAVKEVEHVTFSAQFPPPEWLWYQQQMNKQKRVEAWVKTQNNHVSNGKHVDSKDIKEPRSHRDRKSHRESKKSHRINTLKAMCPHDHGFKIASEVNKENQRPNMGDNQQMTMRYQGSELTDSQALFGDAMTGTQPSSHQRYEHAHQRLYRDEFCSKKEELPPRLPVHSTPLYSNKHHPPSRPCNRCQCDESYIGAPLHDIQQNRPNPQLGRDTDYHVVGKITKKHTKLSKSRDCGVNVVDKPNETGHRSHHQHRHRKSKHGSSRPSRSSKPSHKEHMPDILSAENAEHVVSSEVIGQQNMQTVENVYENIEDVKNIRMSTCDTFDSPVNPNCQEKDALKHSNEMQLSENSVDDSEFSYNTAIHVTEAVIHCPMDKVTNDTKDLVIADSGLGQSQETNYSEDSDRINAFDNKICDGIYFSKPCNSLRDLNNGPDVNIGEDPIETVYEKFTEDTISRQNTNSVNLLNNQIEKYTQKNNNLIKADDNKVPDESRVEKIHEVDLIKQELQTGKGFDMSGDFEIVGIV